MMSATAKGIKLQDTMIAIVIAAKNQNQQALSALVPAFDEFSIDKPSLFFQGLISAIQLLGQEGDKTAIDFLLEHDWLYSDPGNRLFANERLILATIESYARSKQFSILGAELQKTPHTILLQRMLQQTVVTLTEIGFLEQQTDNSHSIMVFFISLKNENLCKEFFNLCVKENLIDVSKTTFKNLHQQAQASIQQTLATKQHIMDKYRITEKQASYWPTLFFVFHRLSFIPNDVLLKIAFLVTPFSEKELFFIYNRMYLLDGKEMLKAPNRQAILEKIRQTDIKLYGSELEIEKQYKNSITIISMFNQAVARARNFFESRQNHQNTPKR